MFITPGTGTGDAFVNILVPGAGSTPSVPTATIGVHATANAFMRTTGGTTGNYASAYAAINTGVYQLGVTNRDSVSINLTNHGNINIQANAYADNGASTTNSYGGHGALANASLGNGIVQTGSAPVSDTLTLTNTGNINIHANATANAYNVHGENGSASNTFVSATAYAGALGRARIGNGILQDASSSPVDTVGLTNSGDINIYSYANAHASSAYAYAHVSDNFVGAAEAYAGAAGDAGLNYGINQNANGITSATVSLTNSAGGFIGIGATANASNNSDATAHAHATGVYEFASAYAGAAVYAGIIDGISQTATSATPSVTLTNSGTIEINVTADGYSDRGRSVATASAYFDAHALAFAGVYATASIDNGIYQSATGAGGNTALPVSVTLTNNDKISIKAAATGLDFNHYAEAHGYSNNISLGDRSVFGAAIAADVIKANIGGGGTSDTQHGAGIGQYASGNTPSVTLTNSGTLTIAAVASAYAHGFDTGLAYASNQGAGSASAGAYAGALAYATVDMGIQQRAVTLLDRLASATMTNNAGSKITIAATAYAEQTAGNLLHPGASAYVTANASDHGQAFASAGAGATANLFNGILQTAAGGAATIGLSNSGEIDITAVAETLSKYAKASAYATGGNGANAKAYAGAFAHAYIGHGVSQYADATSGDGFSNILLANDATGILKITAEAKAIALSPSAAAVASGGYPRFYTAFDGASAYASIGTGIKQTAWGYATLTNSGALTISVNATAEVFGGPDIFGSGNNSFLKSGAYADGLLGIGIYQDATASSTGVAQMTNNATGVLSIGAKAVAQGYTASAYAYVGEGIHQYAYVLSFTEK